MKRPISELDSKGLLQLVKSRRLDEMEALQVLRSPYCNLQVAEVIAADSGALDADAVRQILAGFPGFNLSQSLSLLATLPWTSLLAVAQTPRTPPVVRRHAERKILQLVPGLALGEKIALARRAHRILFQPLVAASDEKVLLALLDNPRLVENDLLVILNTSTPPREFFSALAGHRRWGRYLRVRRALVQCPHTPLPLALSVLVQLPTTQLRQVLEHPEIPDAVAEAARSLLEREAQGRRRVIKSSGDVSSGGGAQPSEDLR
jgi:hypothetical protein